MDLNFKGLPQLLKHFPDHNSAREYFEQVRWNGTPICPYCSCEKWYKLGKEGQYKCGNRKCHKKYSVTVGTMFQSSHIPLNIWFAAMYLISSHKKGIASHQIAKDLAITQKTAWFMLHRIREMAKEKETVILKGSLHL
jgi:hypothetical protein